jgi:peptidoglycan/xylan/chitin deacetylase (PgdA/CDA1 family)
VILPALAISGKPVSAPPLMAAVAAAIGLAFMSAALPFTSTRLLAPVGVAMVGVAAWLLAQASYPVGAWLVAPTLGVGLVLATAPVPVPARGAAAIAKSLAPPIAAAALLALVRYTLGRDAVMAAGAAFVAASALGAWIAAPTPGRWQRRSLYVAVIAPLLALTTTAYIGATTPSATWFGSLIHNGPRDKNEVALTFDDGPDPPYTAQIAAVLDSYGVKGTFFTVGKALEARPDASKALLDDGHLLGNHSYNHDAIRWLDPGYPELQDTQDAFARNLGVCPALYRPPHGSHTPFMSHVVEDHGMTMVTWDVSAADWATNDPALVAKRVLDKVKPGSIILLHDGIDGNIGADRSVVVEALPAILDGLRERGLKPVRLDELLGVRGWLDHC